MLPTSLGTNECVEITHSLVHVQETKRDDVSSLKAPESFAIGECLSEYLREDACSEVPKEAAFLSQDGDDDYQPSLLGNSAPRDSSA